VPTATGGNPQSLARAERALGASSWAVTLAPPPFGYDCDEVLWREGDSLPRREFARWRLYRRALADYDVIHFNFGQSILTWGGLFSNRATLGVLDRLLLPFARHLELLDLPALRRAGKVIAVTYQGDDARQGDFCRRHFGTSLVEGVGPGYYAPWSDARKRERIARFARFADLIYGVNPDLLHVLPPPARFVPFANIDLAKWTPRTGPARSDGPLRVVHAPSHRGSKGTPHVLDAVQQLQREGLRFEFRLVEGLVIDQLLAGWYGGLAVEAMALGKPVIAYVREADLQVLPRAMREAIPLISAEPRNIREVLRACLDKGSAGLAAIGRSSRHYVEAWHDPLKVARILLDDYEGILRKRGR
jgi:hypothetical protein